MTALFFALGHGAGLSVQAWGAMVAQTLLMGLAFGYARHRTGSLLSPILLHIGVNGMGIAAMAAPPRFEVPGYNAPGAHTPIGILAASLAVGRARVLVARREVVPAIPVVPVHDERIRSGIDPPRSPHRPDCPTRGRAHSESSRCERRGLTGGTSRSRVRWWSLEVGAW